MNRLDIIASIGEYTNAQGETKKRFVKIGAFFDKGNGNLTGKIDQIPVNWDGWWTAKPPLDKKPVYKGLPQDDEPF